MEPIVGLRHYWNHDSIRPGMTGSVGDVLVVPTFKKSSPDMPLRFDPSFYKRQKQNGSEMTREPYVKSRGFGGKRGFKISHGWYYQDRREPAKSTEPTLSSIGDYSWKNKIATVVKSRVSGNKFLPLPGEYKLPDGAVPRGGSYPIISSEIGTIGAVSDKLVHDEFKNKSVVTNPANIPWAIPAVKNV